MIYLLATLVLTTLIFIIFREFDRFKVRLLTAITINYWVCVLCGILTTPNFRNEIISSPPDWIPLAIFQGSLFISLFFLIGTATQRIGVAYVAILTRVSVIFPTGISIIFFDEISTLQKIIGISIALMAIIFLHLKYFLPSSKKEIDKVTPISTTEKSVPIRTLILFSTALFFGTGLTDTNFTIFKHKYISIIAESIFSVALFGVSASLGTIVLIFQYFKNLKSKNKLSSLSPIWISILGGIILGIPNYYSIYFLILSLNQFGASVFFPVFNIGILILAGIIGRIVYRESMEKYGIIGIILSMLAIYLIVS